MKLLEETDIIEINKKIGENGTVINEANLQFTINKLSKDSPLARKAAALLYDLVTFHIFLDGNKRTAFVSTVTLLEINGKHLKITDEDALDLVYGIANQKYNIHEIEKFIQKCTK